MSADDFDYDYVTVNIRGGAQLQVLPGTRSMHPTLSNAGTSPSFTIQATDGKARSGYLITKHGTIQTPATLMYTRRGNPYTLTPDIVAKMDPLPQGFQPDILQFLASPSPETLTRHSGGAHGYLALHQGVPVVATNRDPTQYEYGNKPNNDKQIYATIHTGGIQATTQQYMAAVAALQPDLWVSMCDEITGDAKQKRVVTSVDRSHKWLDACLSYTPTPSSQQPTTDQQQQQQEGQDQPQQSSEQSLASCALAAVMGCGIESERARSAKGVADKPVAGFALCGFGTGEDPAQRPRLIQAALQHLPPEKPRFISGLTTPGEVLQGVLQGIDIFDDAYVYHVTQAGYSLCFPLQPSQGQRGITEDPVKGTDDMKMNLWSAMYSKDRQPLVKDCKCYTCQRHTRSYIHHMLQANEMLADVLLEVHNTHHYQQFMTAVREAIQANQLQAYVQWFTELRHQPVQQVEPATGAKRWHPAGEQVEGQPAEKRAHIISQ